MRQQVAGFGIIASAIKIAVSGVYAPGGDYLRIVDQTPRRGLLRAHTYHAKSNPSCICIRQVAAQSGHALSARRAESRHSLRFVPMTALRTNSP